MTERSHGKDRPSLPRMAQVAVPAAEPEPTRQRDAKGRFTAGNSVGIGRGWKAEVRKMLGRLATDEATRALAREASRLYSAMLAELPTQGAQVNPLVAARARAVVLSGYYAARASELGLDGEDGRKLMELSIKLDARAERLAVTALDLASKLAKVHTQPEPLGEALARAFGPQATAPALQSPPPTRSTQSPANASDGGSEPMEDRQ